MELGTKYKTKKTDRTWKKKKKQLGLGAKQNNDLDRTKENYLDKSKQTTWNKSELRTKQLGFGTKRKQTGLGAEIQKQN